MVTQAIDSDSTDTAIRYYLYTTSVDRSMHIDLSIK